MYNISMKLFYLKVSMFIFLFSSCTNTSEPRLLALGGTHVLESEELCKLVKSEPKDVAKDLAWGNKLALEASAPCIVEVLCNEEIQNLEFVKPERIEVSIIRDQEVTVGDKIEVKANLYDHLGRELDVGKFTVFNWESSDIFEIENDSSAGEFGLCDTCFGRHHFRVLKLGKGIIEVNFGNLKRKIEVEVVR